MLKLMQGKICNSNKPVCLSSVYPTYLRNELLDSNLDNNCNELCISCHYICA